MSFQDQAFQDNYLISHVFCTAVMYGRIPSTLLELYMTLCNSGLCIRYKNISASLRV
jgi:hypothetical protein